MRLAGLVGEIVGFTMFLRGFLVVLGPGEEGRENETMSKWGKRKQSYASDGDSDDHAPSKKSSMKDSDDPDNIIVCEISRNRRVSVRNWQGKVQVDIREFYVKDGKQMPGKKGISLTMDQWNVLRDHVNEIDEAVADNA